MISPPCLLQRSGKTSWRLFCDHRSCTDAGDFSFVFHMTFDKTINLSSAGPHTLLLFNFHSLAGRYWLAPTLHRQSFISSGIDDRCQAGLRRSLLLFSGPS